MLNYNRAYEDTIQPYIDLWESLPVRVYSDKSPPPVPPKDKVPPKQKQHKPAIQPPAPATKSPRLRHTGTLQQPRMRNELLLPVTTAVIRPAPARLNPVGVDPEKRRAVQISEEARDAVAELESARAGNYRTSLEAMALVGTRPEWPPRREEKSSSEKLPFTPDELWNFHRPRTPCPMIPTTYPSPIRQMTLPVGRDGEVVPISDTIVSFTDLAFEHYHISGGDEEAAPSSPSSSHASHQTNRTEPTSPTSTLSSASFYDSPASSVSQWSQRSGIDGNRQSVNGKAAKVLGIDPSTRMIGNRVSAPAGLPDRYNSHRTRSSSLPYITAASLQMSTVLPARVPSNPLPVSTTRTEMPYDATFDAVRVWNALYKDKKLSGARLSATLVEISHGARQNPKLPRCRQRYSELYSADMLEDVRVETAGNANYQLALSRLIGGPYEAEAQSLKSKNESNIFMDDKIVAEVLFGKNPEEIRQIKHHFQELHGRSLQQALEDLYMGSETTGSVFDTACPSAAFGRACIRALRGDRQVETVETLSLLNEERLMKREQRLIADVENLYMADPSAGQRRGSATKYLNKNILLELVMRRSNLYLAELCRKFQESHGMELAELAQAKDRTKMQSGTYFPVSLGYAVAYVLKGAINRPHRDAKLLDDSMKGIYTNDARLIARLIRIHYDSDPRHMLFVKEVYRQRFGKRLSDKVWKNTKGPYRELLLKMIDGRSDVAI